MDLTVKTEENSAYIAIDKAAYKIIASNEKFKAIISELLEQILNKLTTELVIDIEKNERRYIVNNDARTKLADADIALQIVKSLTFLNFNAEIKNRTI